MRSRPSTDQGAATDHHLDSVIQLKVQLAQKQATLDELSSKYNALLVQKRAHPHNMVAENSRLMRENERVVPAFTNKKDTEELDLNSMTKEELKLLQKKGKQSRRVVVAAVPISFINSDDDPLSQFCSLLPTLLLLWNRSILVLLHSCSP
jgi:hypothetical protein